jgi:hypothetical protein
MVDGAKLWQRFGTGLVSALAFALVFWLAFHSVGSDWFISQTHADIMFTAFWRFHEFPFFSFVFGGGTYFLQDPQSNLFSFAHPLIVLTGPSNGLRLAEATWAAIGCYGFIVWMRRHVSEIAAQFGGLAWCVSLGVFWRVTVGNDMFLWHLGLPILLVLIEDLVSKRTWQSAVALGLVVGVFLLGPTFHTFMYLFGPVLPIFGLFALALERPNLRALGRIFALLSGALALGLLIVSPKLACWTKFPMGRPTPDPGTPSIADTLRALYDYTIVAWYKVPMGVQRRHARYLYWGIEEAAVALPPSATLLVPLGMIVGLIKKNTRLYAIFALVLIAVGFTITTSGPLWLAFRELTHGNFRVAPRYLALAWFGLAVLAALGADALFTRWQRAQAPIAALFFTSVLVSGVWWTHAAGAVVDRSPNDTVTPTFMNPFAMGAEEFRLISQIQSFDRLRYLDELAPGRDFLLGIGTTNGFLVVGNDYDKRRWFSRRSQPVIYGLPPESSTVAHTRIELRNVPPQGTVTARLVEPQFGLDIETVPPKSKLAFQWSSSGLTIHNTEPTPLERIVLRPKLPISFAWFLLSLFAVLGACAALTHRRWARRPAVLRRFTFSV